MRLLIDTHVALWALTEPERLPDALVARLRTRDNEVFVSIASVWEVAIKHSLKRRDGSRKLEIGADKLLGWIEDAGIDLLAVSASHCRQVNGLPYRNHPVTGQSNGDPFDRMLVAQAMAEPMRLVTADPLVAIHELDAPGLIEKI